jgi:selenocysteine lyase/cysteine desulfurase
VKEEPFEAYRQRIDASLGPLKDEREWSTAIEPNLEAIRQSIARGGGGPDDEPHWALVRQQFSFDHGYGYLNTGTLGASPLYVRRKTAELRELVERDPWNGSGRVGQQGEEAMEKLAALLHADPEELAFTRNITESMVRLAAALNLRRGDLIVTTNREHHGGRIAWDLAHSWRGVRLVHVDVPLVPDDPAQVDEQTLDRFRQTFEMYNTARYDRKTKLLSVSHMFSGVPRRIPARALCALARSYGYLTYLDGAQTVGMIDVDLHDTGCDFYGNSTHKWLLAPKGTGFLYVRKDRLADMKGLFTRDALRRWHKEKATGSRDISVRRLGAWGTHDQANLCGIGFAVDFLNLIGGIRKVEDRGWALACRLRDGIQNLPGLQFITPNQPAATPPEKRHSGSLTAFLLKDAGEIGEQLRTRHVIFPAHGEWARVSTHYYNTPAQVDRVIGALREIANKG